MLEDSFNRKFEYLRLSITDVCNFRCVYCLPQGFQKSCNEDKASAISTSEIKHLVTAFARLGTRKIRITGGEPSLRKDLPDIIALCKATPGIESVAVTTNGYKLKESITDWVAAGLDRLNVSVDSFDPRLFHAITGHDRLQVVLEGVDKALAAGVKHVKLNAVLLKSFNFAHLQDSLLWIKNKKVTVRFIELMQTGVSKEFFQSNHVSGLQLKTYLQQQQWQPVLRSRTAGPAQEFQHPDYEGRIGIIMPYSPGFCDTCNRLRVSSQGNLHLCLFGEQGFPLRDLCRSGAEEDLIQRLHDCVAHKKASHRLHQEQVGLTSNLAMLRG